MQLLADNVVDNAVVGSITRMGLLEGRGQHAIFRHPVQYAVGADNRGVLRTRKDQHAYQNNKAMKEQPGPHRSGKYIEMPPIRLAKYSDRTLSGIIMTAKNETNDVKSRL